MSKSQSNDSVGERPRILDVLRRKKRALHVSELRGRIGLPREEHSRLFRELEAMAEDGLVTQLPGGRFRLARGPRKAARTNSGAAPPGDGGEAVGRRRARARLDEREGILTVNARGFGFVVTDEPGPDVFVPAPYLGGALHGDRVRVQASRSDKGLDGRVREIVERASRYIGGQLHVTVDGAWIEPDDERLRLPVHVGGKLPEGARTGLGVIAKVVGYPERAGGPLEVRILDTFDPAEFVQFETRRILLREGIEESFPADVVAEAQALPHAVPAADKRGREDLRHLPLMTIDPADARDHDDAVWAEALPGGGFRVLVAIADVSHYVASDSALDREALERGCTIYLPTRAIPMLPAELSSNLASLVPRRDRLTLAVEVELGAGGAIKRHRFIEGVMRSAARLTYEGVARALGLTQDGPSQPAAVAHRAELAVLLKVAEALSRKRRRRGALGFELPEAKVRVDDETGQPIDVERSRRNQGVARAYGMIEELMLLANEVVAQELSRRGVPTIYRVHAPPDPERIDAFTGLARALGFDLRLDEDDDAPLDPKPFSELLLRIEGTPHARALGYLLLRALKQATYDTENVGHFGLAAPCYVHFTSPIRRYPDLAVHRIVRSLARGEKVKGKDLRETLQRKAEQASQRERRAMSIEREVVDLYGAFLMRDQVGEVFDAVISGVTEHGFYASIDSPFVDVYCRIASLPPDHYQLDAFGVRLWGLRSGRSYALGDRVRLRIEDVSIAQRKVSAVPADTPPGASEGVVQRQSARRRRGKEKGLARQRHTAERRGRKESKRERGKARRSGRRKRR